MGDEAVFEVVVSSGTYVRTLIETLEDAYCSALRRTAVGPLDISLEGRVLSPLEGLAFLPRVELDEVQARMIGHGRKLDPGRLAMPSDVQADGPGSFTLVHRDNLIAVARLENEAVRPEVVMEPA